MQPYMYGLVAVGLAVWFRYGLGLTAATLRIGKLMAETDTGTGFQDAITPPLSTKASIVCWCSIIYFLYYTYTHGGGNDLITVALIFIGAAFFAGITIIPGPTSAYWIRVIFRSLTVRAADYKKNGDIMRSEAALEMLHMLYAKVGHRL